MSNLLINEIKENPSEEITELSKEEQEMLAGGATLAGNIAMTLAAGWAGTVAGFAAGTMVPGFGNAVGAAVGGGVGILAGIGYALASD
jgi:hypothetical protein